MLRIMKNLVLLCYVAIVFVLTLLFGSGCGWPPPPDYYSIDSEFSEPQKGTIRAAFDDWCREADYCPTEALWADRGRVILVDDLPEDDYTRDHCPEGMRCTTSGTNSQGDVILIAKNRPMADDLAQFWFVVAHEVGHYCIQEHTATGLMIATGGQDDTPEIDALAVRRWHEGCP